jgi:acyl CoA:acetate/3-ketoacid CoA transferase beta subunit
MAAVAAIGEGAATERELDAILVSRFLRDGERLFLGANLNAARAGALLAAMTHAPNLVFAQALAWIRLPEGATLRPPHSGIDLRDAAYAEAVIRDDEVFDDIRRFADVFVLGGLEIDAHGGTNMVGQGGPGRWQRRGPGPIGTTTMAALAPRKMLYTQRHSPRVFVERCAHLTGLGWRAADGRDRAELGLEASEGPEICVSPAGVFDFPGPDRRMRLRELRPGWDVERVRAETGFELDLAADVAPVPDPTDEELHVLRTRIEFERQR